MVIDLMELASEVSLELSSFQVSEEDTQAKIKEFLEKSKALHVALKKKVELTNGSGTFERSCYESELDLRTVAMGIDHLALHIEQTLQECKEIQNRSI